MEVFGYEILYMVWRMSHTKESLIDRGKDVNKYLNFNIIYMREDEIILK